MRYTAGGTNDGRRLPLRMQARVVIRRRETRQMAAIENTDDELLRQAGAIFDRLDLIEATNYLRQKGFREKGAAIQILLAYCHHIGEEAHNGNGGPQ